MTRPRAVGSRTTYDAVPVVVRAWVESVLGSPVVATAEQAGGFSPGCATRLTCADGTRAFVKAVGVELNPDTPTLFRREVAALTELGSHPLWADLLASYDDGGWVALLLEDVEGSHPDLGDDAVMDRLLVATDELGRVMRTRVPRPSVTDPGPDPGPAFFRPGPVDVGAVFVDWLGSFDALIATDDAPAPAWVRTHGPELRGGVAALAEQPTGHAVHYDIRNDNLLQRTTGRGTTGEIVFLDWGAFGLGPDWLDPLLARLERVDATWFDDSLAGSPALARVGDSVVTSWLVGMGAHLAWRAHSARDVNLPGIADFRRRESTRFLGAAARRLAI